MLTRILASLLVVAFLVPVAQACTAFVVYRNGLALAGNNEDFWETDTKLWFVPKAGSDRGVAGKLGRVYFGFDNFYPQGGMNEAGLFFDGFATAEYKVKNSLDRPYFEGNIADYVMANCATVSEVVGVFEKHNLSILNHAMLMFGDQHGDSVIIEGDEFLRIEGDHQVLRLPVTVQRRVNRGGHRLDIHFSTKEFVYPGNRTCRFVNHPFVVDLQQLDIRLLLQPRDCFSELLGKDFLQCVRRHGGAFVAGPLEHF